MTRSSGAGDRRRASNLATASAAMEGPSVGIGGCASCFKPVFLRAAERAAVEQRADCYVYCRPCREKVAVLPLAVYVGVHGGLACTWDVDDDTFCVGGRGQKNRTSLRLCVDSPEPARWVVPIMVQVGVLDSSHHQCRNDRHRRREMSRILVDGCCERVVFSSR